MGFKIKIKAPKIKIDNKTLSNIGKNAAGFVSPLYAMASKKPEEMKLPGESPEQTALRERLYGEAKDFRSNLSDMQGDQRNNITRGANTALESGERGVRTSMNQRGMLYSGMREAGEQGVRANVASQMAKQTAQSNKELEDLASKKEQVAASVGLDSYRDAVAREEQQASMNMANQVARQQAMQQLGQSAGYMAGSYYGRSSAPATTASTPSTYSGTTMGGQSNLNTSAMGKAGGPGQAPLEMMPDKHSLQAQKVTQASPQPTATGILGVGQPAQSGSLGSAAQQAILNRMKGVA